VTEQTDAGTMAKATESKQLVAMTAGQKQVLHVVNTLLFWRVECRVQYLPHVVQ
jgi:hypothetical protein